MPKLVTGYHTDDKGVVTETEMYEGDLNEACIKFPHEWSKTGKSSAAKAAKKVARKIGKKVKKPAKVATTPFPKPATPPFPPAKPAPFVPTTNPPASQPAKPLTGDEDDQ